MSRWTTLNIQAGMIWKSGRITLMDPQTFSSNREIDSQSIEHVDTPDHAWGQQIDELLRIRKRSHDLNGEFDEDGSFAPAPELVDQAIRLAQKFQKQGTPPPDFVIAGVNATVLFEWRSAEGYREIEVLSPVEVESRLIAAGSTVVEVSRLDCA